MSTVREEFGLACPKCGSDRDLRIAITTWIELTPDGSVTVDDHHEWDHRSLCRCRACGYRTSVDAFTARERGVS